MSPIMKRDRDRRGQAFPSSSAGSRQRLLFDRKHPKFLGGKHLHVGSENLRPGSKYGGDEDDDLDEYPDYDPIMGDQDDSYQDLDDLDDSALDDTTSLDKFDAGIKEDGDDSEQDDSKGLSHSCIQFRIYNDWNTMKHYCFGISLTKRKAD